MSAPGIVPGTGRHPLSETALQSLNIRPSACGAYIVALIGAYPQVIPFREAIALRDLYRAKAGEMAKAEQPILEEHERQMAHVLSNALREGADFNRASKVLLLEAGAD
jgi:hypothetical protein